MLSERAGARARTLHRRRVVRRRQLQSRHPADHVGHLLPLPRSGQELAHGGHAARYPRRSAEADASPASRRSCPAIPDKSAIIAAHLRHESGARHAAEVRAQGADRRRRRTPSAAGWPRARSTKATGRISRSSGRAVPEVAKPQAPIRNPIDAFIQARLAREGLTPSPEADRRTLIRRVTLDLTGLPPTPAGDRSLPERQVARCLREGGRSPARLAALCRAAGACTGSTRCATPTPRLPRRQYLSRPGPIAITCCAPSATTSRSTSSRASNWPAICCPTPRSTSRSPPPTTA